MVQHLGKRIICVKQSAGADQSVVNTHPNSPQKRKTGIAVNNFCLHLGKQMIVKNLTKVVKTYIFYPDIHIRDNSLPFVSKHMHFYNSLSHLACIYLLMGDLLITCINLQNKLETWQTFISKCENILNMIGSYCLLKK